MLGIKILMVMTVYNATPFLHMIMMPIVRCWKQWRAKSKVLQGDMNDTLLGWKFDLTYPYSYTLV